MKGDAFRKTESHERLGFHRARSSNTATTIYRPHPLTLKKTRQTRICLNWVYYVLHLRQHWPDEYQLNCKEGDPFCETFNCPIYHPATKSVWKTHEHLSAPGSLMGVETTSGDGNFSPILRQHYIYQLLVKLDRTLSNEITHEV